MQMRIKRVCSKREVPVLSFQPEFERAVRCARSSTRKGGGVYEGRHYFWNPSYRGRTRAV